MSKDYGSELPAGFSLDGGQPQAQPQASAGLPAGYRLEPAPTARPSTSVKPAAPVPPQPSLGESMWDHFKHGISNSVAFIPSMSDLAVNHTANNPRLGADPASLSSQIMLLGREGANAIRSALGMAPDSHTPEQQESHMGDAVGKAADSALGVKHLAVPTDSFGGKSKSNEYLTKFAEFTGANLIPGAGLVASAEHKLATLMVNQLGTGLASTSAVELKEIGGNLAEKLGMSRQRGEQVGEFLGGLAGPGMVGMGAKGLMKGKAMAQAGAAKAGVTGLSKDAQEAAANSLVQGEITNGINSSPTGQSNMDRAAELGKEIPGFKPVVAQASDSPALVAMHKQVAASSPEALNKAAAADARNAQAIEDFKNSKFPTQKKTIVQPGEQPPGKSPEQAPAAEQPATPTAPEVDVDGNPMGFVRKKDGSLRKLSDQEARNQLREKRLADQLKQAQDNEVALAKGEALPSPAAPMPTDPAPAGFVRRRDGSLRQLSDQESRNAQREKGLEAALGGKAEGEPVSAHGAATAEGESNLDPVMKRPYVVDPVLDPARAKLSATKSINDLEQQKVASDLQKLSDQHARTVDNEAIGERLRQKYWEARQAEKVKQDVNLASLYRDAKAQGVTSDMSDVRDMVKKTVAADRNTFQQMPPLFSKILQEYPEAQAAKVTREATTPTGVQKPIYRTTTTPAVPARNTASFEELHSLYKQANKDWADAAAAGDSTKAFYMGQIKDRLKAKVDEFEGPAHGGFAQKFKDYNASYKQYADTFKNGAGGEIAKRGKFGESRDAEDIVSKTILKSGDKKKGVQDFFRVYGDDPEAARLLHDGVMDNFSKAAMRTGTFSPKAAQNWLAQHKQAMDELPALKGKLENSRDIGQGLVDRRAVLQKQSRMLDRTYLAKVAGSSNSDALISNALANTKDGPKVMKALLAGAKSTESKQAIARAIVDSVTGKGHGLDYIVEHEATLKPVLDQLGPDHWKNLKTLAEAEDISNRVKAPTQVELKKLEDIGTKYTGTSVKSMLASGKAVGAGRLSKVYAIADAAGRYVYKIKGERVAELREAALFDPDLASVMAQMARQAGKPTHGQLLNLQRLSFNAGVVSSIEASGHERDRRLGRNTQD